ncbi:MAG: hypothetical protein HKN04_04355, partial [Rhodothermaceae bacterium]|nr:hypothetical protein [Rhodothermaceae bacterium]
MKTFFRFLLVALLLGPIAAETADAQGILGRARDAARRGAERAVEREAQRRADRAVTSVINAAADAVICVITDEACIEQARAENRPVVYTDTDGNPVDETGNPVNPATAGAATQRPGEGAWANYD